MQVKPAIAFVFRPGGVQDANVYTVWADLMAAIGSVEGLKILEFDDSLDICVIPPGTWNMRDVSWTGYGPRGPEDEGFASEVHVSEGALLPGLRMLSGQIIVICEADTTPPVSDFGPGGSGNFVQVGHRLDDGFTALKCVGGAPFFDFGATFVTVNLHGQWNTETFGSGFGTTPPGRVDAGGTVRFFQRPDGLIGPNCIDAPAGSTVVIDFAGNAPIANDQSSILGELIYRNPQSRSRFLVNPGSINGAAPVPSPVPIDGPQTTDCLLLDTTAGDITQFLPSIRDGFSPATGPALTMGHLVLVKNAVGTHKVNVKPDGTDLIDGGVGPIVIGRRRARIFYSDGVSNWYIVAGF